jgi:hypothetical protein
MWCKQCRQDVPALPSGDMQSFCCPRCGEGISVAPPKAASQPPAYDDWELDEQLRHIGRVLRSGRATGQHGEESSRREAVRFDPPQAGPSNWHMPTPAPGRQRKAPGVPRSAATGVFVWLLLSLGVASLFCGGILLGWSSATGRQELWTIGLPVALTGQIALLVGLVLQLDRLWHDNRAAAAKLDNVDAQLGELKAATTLLGTSHGPTAGIFYSHFAGGASPQLLLTDLKSQIDLLAMKIAQDEQ